MIKLLYFLFRCFPAFLSLQLSALVDSLNALLLKDKAWVKKALAHLRNTVFGDSAGGRVPDAAAAGGNDQRRRLFGFDLGKSVGLELAPTVQMLAELLLCSQGEEVGCSFLLALVFLRACPLLASTIDRS